MENQRLDNKPLSWGTRVGYGCGDVACNVIYGTVGTVLTLFYTDYVGVNPALIGLVMLVSRLFDGVSDMIMGILVENTKSKWGKARPWLLWMCVPYAIAAVLLFTVPHTPGLVQTLYIFVTYNFSTTICHTAICLPYGSLSAMMTRNSSERTILGFFRMGMSPLGRIMVVTFTMPVVKLFGNDQAAWVKAMSMWSAVGLILLLICFATCKETVEIAAKKNQAKVPLGTALKALLTNKYFWMVTILWTMQSVSFSVSGTILPYYCKYLFHDDTWMYSMMFLVETLVLVVCVFLSAPLIQKFGKRNVSLAGAIVAVVGHLLYFINPMSFAWVMASCVIRSVGLAPLNAAVFGMLRDVVEYSQWKSHIRTEGLVFAGSSIGTKVGAGLASAAITGLLSAAGYVSSTAAGAVQPESALNMIMMLYKVGPLFVAGLVAFVLLFYKLDKEYDGIMAELMEREARNEL